tara:strand:+ start:16202 stop:16927 length:726 start_codon:yes stop_codon:yes gene_type:complete
MPTYNEAGNIEDLILQSVSAVKSFGISDIEIIVVDDNSPDNTWDIAGSTFCSDASIRVIRRMKNPGLTNSINEGIENATKDFIVWLDCDFSHPPDKIPQLIFMLNQGYDVAVNSRYTTGAGEERAGKGGALQLFLSRLLNWSVRFLLYPSFSDYTSGFVAVKKEVFDDLRLRGDYGEYFVDFIFRVLKKEKYLVCELPFLAPPRKTGESKTGKNIYDYFMRGRKYIVTVLRLRLLSLFRGL